MKKGFLYIIVLLTIVLTLSAEKPTIYDYAKLIDRNPRLYVIVPGKDATQAEMDIASELSMALDIRKIYKENEISSLSNNLIIIGSPKTNSKIRYQGSDSLISIYGTNLIISGSASQLKKAVNILTDYESNKASLSTDKLNAPRELLSPISDISSLMNILYVISAIVILTGMALIILKSIKNTSSNSNQLTEYPQLTSYAKRAMQKGYTKDQVRQFLINSGWQRRIVDKELKKL